MRLSEALMALEVWAACAAAGTHELTAEGLDAFRLALGKAVERAELLEEARERTAEQLSPRRDRSAVRDAIEAGKVVLITAHRVQRLPDAAEPGRIA